MGNEHVSELRATDIPSVVSGLRALNVDAAIGLPEELFLYVSSITPLVNVDLLIKDDRGRALLTWRDDSYYGPDWHVPGGIFGSRKRSWTASKPLPGSNSGQP